VNEQDVVASVLTDWLAEHGYPVAGAAGTETLVPIDWLRGELIKIRGGNPSKGTATATRRWNRAVDEVSRLLDDFERRTLSGPG
jgi:hypothetical protein